MARVLVVDDEADVRSILGHLLLARGHVATAVADGFEALDRLAEESFDVVVLDVMMPGMSGIEVLDSIRADRRLRRLPVLVLSADSESSSRARGLRHGADDYVAKPFDPEELILRLERLAERSHGLEATLSGDLDFLGLEGLLEVLAQTGTAARVRVPAGEETGEIAVARGRLVSSAFGSLTGSDAVLALLESAQGRFSIAEDEPDAPLPEEAPRIGALLLERAWLEDEIGKRGDSVPSAVCVFEPEEGAEPAGPEAREVPWIRVLEAVRERPGIGAGELGDRLGLAPVRLRLALALLVESGCLRARVPHEPPADEERLSRLLSDLLLEALFSGRDMDRLKIEVMADPPGFAHVQELLRRFPDPSVDGVLERVEREEDRLVLSFRHATGRAEMVVRRVEGDGRETTGVAADALYCVLLALDTTARGLERESRLLVELARSRPVGTDLIWISAASPDGAPTPPWRRIATVPPSLEDLFARLLESPGVA